MASFYLNSADPVKPTSQLPTLEVVWFEFDGYLCRFFIIKRTDTSLCRFRTPNSYLEFSLVIHSLHWIITRHNSVIRVDISTRDLTGVNSMIRTEFQCAIQYPSSKVPLQQEYAQRCISLDHLSLILVLMLL